MKTLSQFLLSETTVPDHLIHRVDELEYRHLDNVDDITRGKMDEAMTHGTHTTFPLKQIGEEADPDVIDHLVSHGYDMKDYQAGIVSKKKVVGDGINHPKTVKHVEERIGSVLEKTKAPDVIKKAYMNDPARSASKSADSLHVVISHHPLAIAGMQTGTGWSSCMNMDATTRRGSVDNSHYLRDDVENGTHVAYLVRGNDHDGINHGHPSNPIARIALKPYHSEEHEDTIFRPEGQYGSGGFAFTHAVKQWAQKNYPAIQDVEYRKNRHVYDDGESTYEELSKNALSDILIHRSRSDMPDYAHSDDVNHLLNVAHSEYEKNKADHPDNAESKLKLHLDKIGGIQNLSAHHVAVLHKLNTAHGFDTTGGSNNWGLAINHGNKFSSRMIQDHLDKFKDNIPRKMLGSKKLPQSVVDSVTADQISSLHPSRINDSHVHTLVDGYVNEASGSYYHVSDMKARLKPEHFDKLVDHAINTQFRTAHPILFTNHPQFTKEHHQKLVSALTDGVTQDKVKSAESLMQSSRHATFYDAKKLDNTPALSKNKHIGDADAKMIKDQIISDLPRFTPRYEGGITTFGSHPKYANRNMQITNAIGKHLTDDDYSTMNAHNFQPNFENAQHSRKLMSVGIKKAADIDNQISKHVESKMDSDDDYDQDEDKHVQNLTKKMHKSLEHVSGVMGDHIDKHVEHEDHRGVIGNYGEKEHTEELLDKLDDLENYKTSRTSDRYDNTEHWDDHFSEHLERLRDMVEHEEHGW